MSFPVRFKLAQVAGIVVVGSSGFPILISWVGLLVGAEGDGEISVEIGVAGCVSEILTEQAHNIKSITIT